MLFALNYDLAEKLPGWIVVVIECILIAFYLKYKANKTELEISKKVFNGYAWFVLGYAICRILFILSDFERLANDESRLYTQFVMIGYMVVVIALAMISRTAETYLLKSKKKFTTYLFVILLLITVVMLILTSIYYENNLWISIARYSLYVITGIGAVLVMIFFLILAKKTTGVLRRKFIFTILGLFLAILGIVLDSEIAQKLLPIWIPPIITGIGFIIFAYFQKQD